MSTEDDIRTTHTIIPAVPGWYVTRFFGGPGLGPSEEYPGFLRDFPIIAWDIEGSSGKATPITLNFNVLLHRHIDEWVFKSPDGEYHLADNIRLLKDEAAVIAHFFWMRERTATAAAQPAAEPPSRIGKPGELINFEGDEYFLDCDDAGGWYIIPIRRSAEWGAGVKRKPPPYPKWAQSVGDRPQIVTFRDPRLS